MALFFCSFQKAPLMTFNIPLRHLRKWNVRCRSPVLWCLWMLSQRCRWLLENKASSIFTLSITLNGACMNTNGTNCTSKGFWDDDLSALNWPVWENEPLCKCIRFPSAFAVRLGLTVFGCLPHCLHHTRRSFRPVAIRGSLSSEMKRQREGSRGRVRRIKASKRRRRADVPRFQEAESDGEQGKAEGTRHVGRRQQ